MKLFLCLIFICFYFYSCSNPSTTTNNSNNNTDSMFIYRDSVSYWGGNPGTNYVSVTNDDTLIKKVRISFQGETDYDSTSIEAIVMSTAGIECDYIKKGMAAINADHTFTVDVSDAKTHSYSFFVNMTSQGIFKHVKLKYIRVSMIRS